MLTTKPLVFGAQKYIAYNLMMAKWLNGRVTTSQPYCYVTMGGTEMYDVVNFAWAINQVHSIYSYEGDSGRYKLAQKKAGTLSNSGLQINLIQGDLFDYRRTADVAHVFFVDLEGICSGQYAKAFREWFDSDTIQAGDILLITSYLGRHAGWDKILKPYEGEFRFLRTTELEDRKRLYKALHPAFVVNRAMLDTGMNTELNMTCLGHIKYFDTSPMGLYCYTFEEGSTSLKSLTTNIKMFDIITRSFSDL